MKKKISFFKKKQENFLIRKYNLKKGFTHPDKEE